MKNGKSHREIYHSIEVRETEVYLVIKYFEKKSRSFFAKYD